MIKSITVINDLGDMMELELTRPEKSGLVVKSISGLDPVKANIDVTELTNINFFMYRSSNLTSRNIVINLEYLWLDSIEAMRQKTYRFFPIGKKVTLIIETDNRLVKTDGYVESNEINIFSKNEGSTISIICPDPSLYSINNHKTVSFNDTSDPFFEFQFSNEALRSSIISFGEVREKTRRIIDYDGDNETGLVMTISATGNIGDITITNIVNNQNMNISASKISKLTGSGIVGGDKIIINTKKDDRSIQLHRNNKVTNIINCIGINDDWFVISKGVNLFTYTVKSGVDNIRIMMEYDTAYGGI